MKPRIPDENVDRLLRNHATQSTPPSLTEEERTAMIATLLARDTSTVAQARPTRTGLFSVLRRPPVLALAAATFGILVLVGVGLVRFGLFRSAHETAQHAPPSPSAPTDTCAPAAPPPTEKLRPFCTLATISTSFMMRGDETSSLPTIASRDSVFSWIREALAPLGITCTRRGSVLVTSLSVQPRSGDSTTLRFVFSTTTGEVRAQPATFRIGDPRISDDALRDAIARVSEAAYRRFRAS